MRVCFILSPLFYILNIIYFGNLRNFFYEFENFNNNLSILR